MINDKSNVTYGYLKTVLDIRNVKISDENEAVAFHNSNRGGKDITAWYTDGSLWKRLGGTDGYSLFEGLFPGDYWKLSKGKIRSRQDNNGTAQTNEGTDYVMIAGFDTLWGNGDGTDNVEYHHIVCIPGKPDNSTMNAFGQHRMNSSNTTSGGYKGSQMYSSVLGSVTSTGKPFASGVTINEQLVYEFGKYGSGGHLCTTRELLTKSMDSSRINRWGQSTGASSEWEWTSVQAVLMSEVEVYGSIVWSSSGYDTGSAKAQLPVFRMFPNALNNRRSWYWLKDVASSTGFCNVSGIGYAGVSSASRAGSFVRPRFVLRA